jgi:hypothetical protein
MLALFVAFCFLALLLILFCLITPAVYDHAKPKTKKKVVELTCDGWLARKMADNNWAAFTLPLPFVVLIFYWVSDSASSQVDQLVRVHEFVHVHQDEGNVCFLVSWVKYGYELVRQRLQTRSWMQAYVHNRYEAQAYEVEDRVWSGEDPRPDWAM